MTERIYIDLLPGEPTASARDRYEVRHGRGGPVIVASTRYPFHEGARALADMGLEGGFEMWDGKYLFPRMQGNIVAVSKRRLTEGANGFHNDKWKPFFRETVDKPPDVA